MYWVSDRLKVLKENFGLIILPEQEEEWAEREKVPVCQWGMITRKKSCQHKEHMEMIKWLFTYT